MEYFLQSKTGDEVDRIVARLNKLMDGDVSSQMKCKGVDYKMNYGASVLWLKNLAVEYAGDNVLAERLWLREIRETMIIATLVANPDDAFMSVLDFWMTGIVSDELAEQLGSNIIWRLPDINNFSLHVLKNQNDRQRAAVWIGLSVFMQRGSSLMSEDVLQYLRIIREDTYDSILSQRAKGRFLRQLCRRDNSRIPEVEELLCKLSVHSNLSWLIQDVKTELSFLKGL